MQIQNQDHDNESDQDEGFVPSKITIKEKKQFDNRGNSRMFEGKREFVARYITEGIMRKQPMECYKRFSTFDYIDQKINIQIAKGSLEKQNPSRVEFISENSYEMDTIRQQKNKQKLLTPFEKYVESGDYKLVYSRYKGSKFTKESINFASNDVKLDCLKSTQQINFKPIKPFQIIEQKSESTFTQGVNKNSSIRQSLLQFDSKFQSGNLLWAYKHKRQPFTYTLFIQNDTNTNGYNQWFYFSIRKAQTKVKYKFYIVNFRKRQSFFREGNQPVVFSLQDSKKEGMSGYSKRGDNVQYGRSPIVKQHDSKEKFYQLSFQLEFHNQNDLIYISMGLPFSYSKLIQSLLSYEEIAQKNQIKYELQSIATSIAGNLIPYLTITGKQSDQKDEIKNISNDEKSMGAFLNEYEEVESQNRQKTSQQTSTKQKKIILLMARQHPGETWSSYLMDEFIHSLISLSIPECQYLLSNFIFKIIPMVNVDGVIFGNFRCDLTGMDLNRNWKNPSSLLHPQIFSIKNQINSLVSQGYTIEACFDLHGHSKQYNIFCYSCKTDNQECRILPFILSTLNQEFHFPFCTFGISKYKQSTARAVIFSIIKNTNVLTVESSFFGSKLNQKVSVFQALNFQKMAYTLLKGCKSYFSRDQNYENCRQIVMQRLDEFVEYKNQKEDVLSGSDSEPEVDQIELTEKLQKIVPKNLLQQCIIEEKIPRKSVRRGLKRKTYKGPEDRFSKTKKQSYNSLNKNLTIDVLSQSPVKQTAKSNWQTAKIKSKRIIETRPSYFKKDSIMISHEEVDQLSHQIVDKISIKEQNKVKKNFREMGDRSEQKLSFFSRQKPSLIPLRMKNQSFQIFRDAYNVTQKYIKHNDQHSLDQIRNSKRNPSKKIGIFKEFKDKELEEFPLLCVLSDTKKKTHVEKIKQRRQSQNSHISKDERMSEKVKTPIQTRTQAIKKLRQKQKNSMQLVSKIWRQNFTRYGMAYSTFKISK